MNGYYRHKDRSSTGALTPRAVINATCKILGHIEKPIYTEEDGHTDDFYCERCGLQI